MICPKCGRPVEEAAVICPGCDFILDTDFLGEDVLDEEKPLRPGRGGVDPALFNLADAVILGDIDDTAQSFETSDSGFHVRESTSARLYVSGRSQALMAPDAIPAVIAASAESVRLTPFEKHVLSYIDGARPVEAIRIVAGLDEAEVKTALATLADKGVVEVVGRALVELGGAVAAAAAAAVIPRRPPPRRSLRRSIAGALGNVDDEADEALDAAFRTQTNLAPLSALNPDASDDEGVFSSEASGEFEAPSPTNELESLMSSSTPVHTNPRRPPTTSFVPVSRTADLPSEGDSSDGFDEFGDASELGATQQVDAGAFRRSLSSSANEASLVDEDEENVFSGETPELRVAREDDEDDEELEEFDEDLDLPGVGSTAIARLANSALGPALVRERRGSSGVGRTRPPPRDAKTQAGVRLPAGDNVLSRLLSDGAAAVDDDSDPLSSLVEAPSLPSEPRPPFLSSSAADESMLEDDDFSGDEYSDEGEPVAPPLVRPPTAIVAVPPGRGPTDSLLSALDGDEEEPLVVSPAAPLVRVASEVFAQAPVAPEGPITGPVVDRGLAPTAEVPSAQAPADAAADVAAPSLDALDAVDNEDDPFAPDDDDDAPTAIRPPGSVPLRPAADEPTMAPDPAPEPRAAPPPSVSEIDAAPAPLPSSSDLGEPSPSGVADGLSALDDDDRARSEVSDDGDGELADEFEDGDTSPAPEMGAPAARRAETGRREPPAANRVGRAPVAEPSDDDDPALSGLIEGFVDISVLHGPAQDPESGAFRASPAAPTPGAAHAPAAPAAAPDDDDEGPETIGLERDVFTSDAPTARAEEASNPQTQLIRPRSIASAKSVDDDEARAAVPMAKRSMRIGNADSAEHTALRDVPIVPESDDEFRGQSAEDEDTVSAREGAHRVNLEAAVAAARESGHDPEAAPSAADVVERPEPTALVERGGRSVAGADDDDGAIDDEQEDVVTVGGLKRPPTGFADSGRVGVPAPADDDAQATEARGDRPPHVLDEPSDEPSSSVELISDERVIRGRRAAPSSVISIDDEPRRRVIGSDQSELSALDSDDSGYEGSELSDEPDASFEGPTGTYQSMPESGAVGDYRLPDSLIEDSQAESMDESAQGSVESASDLSEDPDSTAYVNHPASHLISSAVDEQGSSSGWEGEGTVNIDQLTKGESSSTGVETRGESRPVLAARGRPPPSSMVSSDSEPSSDLRAKARRYFDQALRDHREGRDSRARMNAKLASVYDPHNEEYRAALEQWEAESRRRPSTTGKPREVLLYEEAQRLEGDDEIDAAIALLREGIDINPHIAAFHNRLGVILALRKHMYAEAAGCVRRAVELEPDNLHYKSNYGKIVSKAKMKGQLTGSA